MPHLPQHSFGESLLDQTCDACTTQRVVNFQTLSTARHVPASPMIDKATCRLPMQAVQPAQQLLFACLFQAQDAVFKGATCWAHVHTLMFEMQRWEGTAALVGGSPLGVGVQGLDLIGGRGVHKGDLGVDLHQRCADGVHKDLQPDACEPQSFVTLASNTYPGCLTSFGSQS